MDNNALDQTSDIARNINRKTANGWRMDIGGKLAISLTKVEMITFAGLPPALMLWKKINEEWIRLSS